MNWKPFSVILVLMIPMLLMSTGVSAQSNPLITSIAWSPDGSKIAIGGGFDVCDPEDPTPFDVKIIDAQTQQKLQTVTGFNCRIRSIDWSPDGRRLAITSGVSGLTIWDSFTGELVTPFQGELVEVKWHPDGDLLAATIVSNGIIYIDFSTSKSTWQSIGGIHLDWSPDGSKLVSGNGYEDIAYVTETATAQEIIQLTGNTSGVTDVDWSPDGSKIATGGGDKTVRVWNSVTGKPLTTPFQHTDIVSAIAWRPYANQLASGDSAGNIILWDINTGEQVEKFQGIDRIYDLEWGPGGSQLAYADAEGGLKFASLAQKPQSTATAQNVNPPIQSLAWSPDGTMIAVGPRLYSADEHDYSIKILNASTLGVLNALEFNTSDVASLDWSPDGKYLVSSSGAGSTGLGIVWNLADERLIVISPPHSMPGRLADLWRPDGTIIANISDGTSRITLWNPLNGEDIATFRPDSGAPLAIAWNTDGTGLATGDTVGNVVLWDLTGTQRSTFSVHENGITTIDWNDTDLIATGGDDDTIRVLNASTGDILSTFVGHTDNITQVTWNPDNTRLASAGYDGTVRVWDLSTERQINIYTAPGRVYALDWSPDGSKLAYGGEGSNTVTVVEPSATVVVQNDTPGSDLKSLYCGF